MKSLELNWIRNKVDKTLPMPEVIYYPLVGVAGLYYHPRLGEMYDDDGKPHSMKLGVIVVGINTDDVKETIAHEWRHHWQYFHGIKFETRRMDNKMTYEKALIKYFTTSRTEWDALRFQYKYTSVHDMWEKTLFHLIKDLHVKPTITYGNNAINNKQKVQSYSPVIGHSHSVNKKTRRIQRRIQEVI